MGPNGVCVAVGAQEGVGWARGGGREAGGGGAGEIHVCFWRGGGVRGVFD